MSSQKSGSDMYNICLKRHNATYTIEQLSDSVLILKNNEFSRMIFISADMLNNQDFVIANSNLIPKDTIGKNRIRGIWAVNSEGKSE